MRSVPGIHGKFYATMYIRQFEIVVHDYFYYLLIGIAQDRSYCDGDIQVQEEEYEECHGGKQRRRRTTRSQLEILLWCSVVCVNMVFSFSVKSTH